MAQHLEATGLRPRTLRARIEAVQWPPPNGHRVLTIVLHPSDLTQTFLGNFIFDPAWVDRTNVRETPGGGGGIIDIITDPTNGDPRRFVVPNGAPWTDQEMRFWSSDQPLNEFGFLYVALFIAGNYARYFPDKWLADVEASTPLAVAVEELTELAAWRAPWLSFSELARICFVL